MEREMGAMLRSRMLMEREWVLMIVNDKFSLIDAANRRDDAEFHLLYSFLRMRTCEKMSKKIGG